MTQPSENARDKDAPFPENSSDILPNGGSPLSPESGRAAPSEKLLKNVSVARSASVMAVATTLSRIMGLVREQSFAYIFGAGSWTDAFNVAFRIPNLLRDLFAEGAMSAAFVPTFNSALKLEGKDRAFRITSLTLTVLFVLLSFITIVGIIFSPAIVGLLAPEFSKIPQKFETTVLMTRIMFPFLLVISWAAISMGILNSLGHFFVPAIAPVFLNLAMILAGFTVCPYIAGFGYPSITGMAIGAMVGGILQMLIQFPSLWKEGYRYRWLWDLKDPGLRKIVSLIIPGTIGLAAVQINVAISTYLATSQGDGAVSWLNYAFRLMQLPLGIFGVAIAQATLPVISRQAADKDLGAMGNTLASSIKLAGFINIAATMALAVLSEPVIRILFEHGRFAAGDTASTALALRAYAVGLFFFSGIKILSPAFYALDDTRTPVFASMTSVLTNIVLNLLFVTHFGYWGLALGSSIAAAVNFGVLYFMLQKKLDAISGLGIGINLLKTMIASLFSGVAMQSAFSFVANWMSSAAILKANTILSDAVSLVAAGMAGVIVLLIVSRILGLEEAGRAIEMVKKKLFRKP